MICSLTPSYATALETRGKRIKHPTLILQSMHSWKSGYKYSENISMITVTNLPRVTPLEFQVSFFCSIAYIKEWTKVCPGIIPYPHKCQFHCPCARPQSYSRGNSVSCRWLPLERIFRYPSLSVECIAWNITCPR